MLRRSLLLLLALCWLALPSMATAQGLLLDQDKARCCIMPRPYPFPRPRPLPPAMTSYKIKELGVDVKLTDQVAKVQVAQTFVNTGNRTMQVAFVFPLPNEGAVESLTFMVDGKEYEAKLLDAGQARSIYEGYIRRNQDPALLEWLGSGMFKTSVFPIPPGAERKVSLRYTQLCRKTNGLTDFQFPLATAKYTSKPVETVRVQINVQSSNAIKNVYSPSHDVKVERPGNVQATVKYVGKDEVPQADFRLLYDVGTKALGASVLSYRPSQSEEGYFVMLASPEIKPVTPKTQRKTVVFVVDRSGSMSGKKMEQAKGALRQVLNNLHEGDLFNIVAYDSIVESFKPELQRFDDKSRKAALGWVASMYAGGSTNIDGALKVALGQLKDPDQPAYVIFMTDGLPTTGEKNELKIVANAKEQNDVRARVFSFGVGYDVNSRLLDRLSRDCFGQTEFVRPKEDIEAAVANLYNRIGSPALTDMVVQWDAEGIREEDGGLVSRVYPRHAYDLFAGDQLVLVGRYRQSGPAKVIVSGMVNGQEQKFDFPADLVADSNDETYAFVEKLWAMRRVGEVIDRIDLDGRNPELVQEMVALSKKHGIITPYTSFLAEGDAPVNIPHPIVLRHAEAALDNLAKDTAGKAGVAQRDFKARLQRAASPSAVAPTFTNVDEDRQERISTVRNLGSGMQTRGKERQDEEIKKAVKIERFGKEYFDLLTKYGKDAGKYLAQDGSVVLKLKGKIYSF